MKNKHLVLMFLVVLVGARLLRNIPIAKNAHFQKELAQILPHEIQRIEWVQHPHLDTLFLAKNDEKWLISEGTRSTSTHESIVQTMLNSFVSLRSTGILKSEDKSSPAVPLHQLSFKIVEKNGREHAFHFLKNAEQHFVKIGNDPLIFKIAAPPPAVFLLKFNELRPQQVVILHEPAHNISATFRTQPPVFFEKKENYWASPGEQIRLPDSTFADFFVHLKKLEQLPFADDFDETQEQELFLGSIEIGFSKKFQPLKLNFYETQNPQTWIVHSSQNRETRFLIPKKAAEQLLFFPAFFK